MPVVMLGGVDRLGQTAQAPGVSVQPRRAWLQHGSIDAGERDGRADRPRVADRRDDAAAVVARGRAAGHGRPASDADRARSCSLARTAIAGCALPDVTLGSISLDHREHRKRTRDSRRCLRPLTHGESRPRRTHYEDG
jgi:hypothetical protein